MPTLDRSAAIVTSFAPAVSEILPPATSDLNRRSTPLFEAYRPEPAPRLLAVFVSPEPPPIVGTVAQFVAAVPYLRRSKPAPPVTYITSDPTSPARPAERGSDVVGVAAPPCGTVHQSVFPVPNLTSGTIAPPVT
jgi:hypothetical protein